MKKFIILFLFIVTFSISGNSQTAIITGIDTNLVGAVGQAVTLQVQIVNCGTQTPLANGTTVITNSYTFTANPSTGIVTGTVYGNDIIKCGTQNYTLYAVTWNINGFPAAPTQQYRLTEGATCNISNGTCKPIGFVPPIIQKGTSAICQSPNGYLAGFNADYSPNCQPTPTGATGATGPQGPGGIGCGVGNCIQANYSIDQVMTGTSGANFSFNAANCSACFFFTGNTTQPITNGDPNQSVNQLLLAVDNTSGPGADPGFFGSYSSLYYPEVTNKTVFSYSNSRRMGVSQGISVINDPKHGGDSMWLYIYSHMRCAWVSYASEGCGIVNFNGTQQINYPIGTVTSTTGTGDRHPVFSVSDLAPESYVIDTSNVVATGNILDNGLPNTPGAVPYGSTFLFTLQVSNTLTPSTGICTTNADIAQSIPLQTLITQTVSCTVIGGSSSAMVNGHAWLISRTGVEQINITNATAGSTSIITFQSQKPHPTGSIVVQGGTNGLMSFDLESLWRTTVYMFGASDSSHFICGLLSPGQIQTCPPYIGYESAIVGSGYHLFKGAEVLSVDVNGSTATLEVNDVAWSAGNAIENPPNASQLERAMSINSTMNSTPNPGSQSGSLFLSINGQGVTQAFYPFTIENFTSSTYYKNKGGNVGAPIAESLFGPFSTGIAIDQPIGALGSYPCSSSVGILLCVRNSDSTTNFDIISFGDRSANMTFNTSNNHWGFTNPLDAGQITQNNHNVCDVTTGCPTTSQLPQTITALASQWLNSYNATTGVFTQSQPSFANISGTSLPNAVVSAPGLTTTAGGVLQAPAFNGSGLSVSFTITTTTGTCNFTYTSGLLTAKTGSC